MKNKKKPNSPRKASDLLEEQYGSLSESARKWNSVVQNPELKKNRQPNKELLKSRTEKAIARINSIRLQLEGRVARLEQRSQMINGELAKAYKENRMIFASVYASELMEVREIIKSISYAKLGLDQLFLRLGTVSELGNVVSTLGPAVDVLHSVKEGIASVFPEAENELAEIGNILSGLMTEAGQGSGTTLDFDRVNEDANKLLSEADTLAEKRIKEKFPDLPPEPTSAKPEKCADLQALEKDQDIERKKEEEKTATKMKIISEAKIIAKEMKEKNPEEPRS